MSSGILTGISPHDKIEHAKRVIYLNYGVKVSVENKKKDLLKYGRNQDVTNATTGSTLMTLPTGINHETYVSTNIIDTLSSSSASDTEIVTIEGHTLSGSDFTFVTQQATLNGQNKVVLTTPLARMTRIYNDNGTNLIGTIYGYEDTAIIVGIPTDGTKVHCMIRAGKNQSEKCSTTISSTDFWIITAVTLSVIEKTPTFADAELEIRRFGKVFRAADVYVGSSGVHTVESYDPVIIVPSNSDVRIVAVGSAVSLDVSASVHGYLASIVA